MLFNHQHNIGLLTLFALFGFAIPANGGDFLPIDKLPAIGGLPDPLVMFNGAPVVTPHDWRQNRRPELKALFQHYVYGYLPDPPGIVATVTKTTDELLDGRCRLKEVTIKIKGLPDDAPAIRLALFLPTAKKRPVPVFLGLNRCGNQTVTQSPVVTIDSVAWRHAHCTADVEASRGAEHDSWCVDLLIERGYAFATFHESNMVPDLEDDSENGILSQYQFPDKPRESRWGTLAGWAWGLQRAVDYLITDEQIDARHIALIGHSRRGKAALLAAAFDERIALVVPHQSGTGGTALSRNNSQETVRHINKQFPHWFNDNFPRFADQEAKLPIDQHLLIALIAPRALLETSGLKDKWANYESSAIAIQSADKVWKLLGVPGVAGSAVVGPETNLNSDAVGNLAQYRLDTRHVLNRDYWAAILDFADKQFQNAHCKPVGDCSRATRVFQPNAGRGLPSDKRPTLIAL